MTVLVLAFIKLITFFFFIQAMLWLGLAWVLYCLPMCYAFFPALFLSEYV